MNKPANRPSLPVAAFGVLPAPRPSALGRAHPRGTSVPARRRWVSFRWVGGALQAMVLAGAVLWLAGCASPPTTALVPADLRPYESVALREGDVVKITFSGAPSLNTTQQVRRDGKISLDQGNELTAAGKSPAELEAVILKLYEGRLASKEVLVTVDSSAFPVYISGAVLRPGKILVTQAMTIVEAIMEAGGLDESRAKASAVEVTREENGQVKHYRLDVHAMLMGRSQIRFYLRPMDAIYVPSKVQIW